MNPHLQRGQMLLQRSRYDEAERELGIALSQDPESAWAYALMGACRAAQKDYAKADDLGKQAMALAPDSADIRHLMARIQIDRNDLPAALKTASEAIVLDPHDASHYATRALIHARRKSWDKALEDSDRALAIDPEHLEAINVRSLARRSKGDMHTATSQLQHALEVEPEDPHSHANLAWTHLQNGKLDLAEQHFREALRLDPELDYARVGVLETLKARVPVYRWILGYFLWMQTKAAVAQWAIVIGLYIAYRVVGGIAANNPALAPFLMPLLVLYLVFVVATWFAKPLGDAALLLHPLGRMALTKQEKREGLIVAGLVLSALALFVGYMATGSELAILLSLLIGTCGLPFAMSFKFEQRQPRRILQAGGVVLTVLGMLVLASSFSEQFTAAIPEGFWRLSVKVLLFSPLATLIGTNVLATKQWRE